MTMAIVNFALHSISAFIFCLAIAILGLVAHGVSLKDGLEYAATPGLKGTSMSFLFWPACGGIVDCCLFLVLWLRTPFHEARSKSETVYLNAILFVASFYFMRPFIVLTYTFVEHDVESWACFLSSQSNNHEAEALCNELRAARYLLIPLFILGVVFLSFVVWLRFGARREKSASGGIKVSEAQMDGAKVQV